VGVVTVIVAQGVRLVGVRVRVEVGTAGGMAAQTKLLFAPFLFASLLVGPGDSVALPATVFAATTAWLLATAVDQRRAPS
jgi:hypothetical protein